MMLDDTLEPVKRAVSESVQPPARHSPLTAAHCQAPEPWFSAVA